MTTEVTRIEEHQKKEDSGEQESGTVKRQRPPRTRDPGSRLRSLGCFKEVSQMVREGGYLRRIARYIQVECGELTELSDKAVMYMLHEYRDYIFSEDVISDTTPDAGGVSEDPFRELHLMQQNMELVNERIQMEVATERQLNKLFSTTHKEFLTLQRLGDSILKKKKELNLLDQSRGGMRQRVGSGLPGKLDVVEEMANPASRQRILNFIDTVASDPTLMDTLMDESEIKLETSVEAAIKAPVKKAPARK